MHIWVDADALPNIIKEVLFKAAQRTGVATTLIANQYVKVPPNKHIQSVVVSSGFDVADNEIVRRCNAGDLVITADIPLAAEVIEKGAQVINPRGEEYTTENIRSRLNIRDFMDTMRASGVQSGGPPPLGQQEKQQFANQLDRILTRYLNQQT